MTLEIDHVVVCVPDLDRAAREYEEDLGVVSVPGGRHPGQGTANRLIPLGQSYIELLAVVDPREARTSALGTWATHRAAVPGADALCLRTDDIGGVGAQLGLQPMEMSRVTPDGVVLTWTLAGLKQSISSGMPFFIEWHIPHDLHPGRADVSHPAGSVTLAGVTISGDETELSRWSSGAEGVAVRQGDPGVTFRLIAGA